MNCEVLSGIVRSVWEKLILDNFKLKTSFSSRERCLCNSLKRFVLTIYWARCLLKRLRIRLCGQFRFRFHLWNCEPFFTHLFGRARLRGVGLAHWCASSCSGLNSREQSGQTSMPWKGFELTVARSETVGALDHTAPVICKRCLSHLIYSAHIQFFHGGTFFPCKVGRFFSRSCIDLPQ